MKDVKKNAGCYIQLTIDILTQNIDRDINREKNSLLHINNRSNTVVINLF
jgi:hypothetical protein